MNLRTAPSVLACWLLAAACTVPAQQTAVAQAHRPAAFEVLLTADPLKTSATGVVHFHVRLKSHMHTPWLVSSPLEEGPSASYDLSIREHQTGKEISPPFFADARLPPGPVHLAAMLPGGHLDAEAADQVQSFGLAAGHTYDVTAIYHSPFHFQTRKGKPVLSASDGNFTSNTVQITVAP